MSTNPARALIALAALLAATALAAADREALSKPEKLTQQAPATYSVKFETSKGVFVVDVTRDWAPLGADRFYNLVRHGFYDDVRFFRVVPGFVVQFGISGDPALAKVWQQARLKDDSVKHSNKAGTVTFALAGPNSRTTQVFINLVNNARLDELGFSPFGVVSQGLDVVAKLHGGYGDGPPRGRGPEQSRIVDEGNAYLDEKFPELDRVTKATIVDSGSGRTESSSAN